MRPEAHDAAGRFLLPKDEQNGETQEVTLRTRGFRKYGPAAVVTVVLGLFGIQHQEADGDKYKNLDDRVAAVEKQVEKLPGMRGQLDAVQAQLDVVTRDQIVQYIWEAENAGDKDRERYWRGRLSVFDAMRREK